MLWASFEFWFARNVCYIYIFLDTVFKYYCIYCYSNSKEPFHSLKQKAFDKQTVPPFAAQQAPRLLCIMPAPCMAVVKIFPLGREQAPKKKGQRLGSELSEITGNLRWLAIQVGWKPHSRSIAIGLILSQVWDAMCHIIHWFHVCFRGCTLRNSEWKDFGLDGWKNELLGEMGRTDPPGVAHFQSLQQNHAGTFGKTVSSAVMSKLKIFSFLLQVYKVRRGPGL